jgi:hypothetical protein|tara:strand:- start:53 stop:424 length:372 start_codon:yes stop_codon:yes gene_type:complete
MVDVLTISIDEKIDIKKTIDDELNNIYKICNYRTNNDFKMLLYIYFNNNYYYIYGKVRGVKKYLSNIILPDTGKIYGSICVIKMENKKIIPIEETEWEPLYKYIQYSSENNYLKLEIEEYISD